MPTVRRVPVAPDVHLAVRDRRPDDTARPTAPTVVLVHGLASTSRLWDGVADALARRGHRTVAVDLRGHGESDAPDDGYDTATAVADLVALLPAVSDGPVRLAGQSWGGNVVGQVAARRPDLVAGLALVDGGWIRLRGRFADWSDAEAALTPPAIDGMAAADFTAMLAAALPAFPDGAVEAAASVVRVDDDGRIQRRLPVPRHLSILRSMWDDDPRAWYGRVQAPTVLMPATADGQLPAEVVEAESSIPHARVRSFPGAHHDVHLQRPGEVAEEIGGLR